MLLYTELPEINDVKLDAITVHFAERYHLASFVNKDGYSESDYILIEKMTFFVQKVVAKHFSKQQVYIRHDDVYEKTKDINSTPKYDLSEYADHTEPEPEGVPMRELKDLFKPKETMPKSVWEKEKIYYYERQEANIKMKEFPEPNFFLDFNIGMGFSYPHPSREAFYELLPPYGDYNDSPYYNKDLYTTFFAFKLRNISIHYINSFLDYQLEKFNEKEENLITFLEVLLIQYKKIIPKPSRKICKIWMNTAKKIKTSSLTIEKGLTKEEPSPSKSLNNNDKGSTKRRNNKEITFLALFNYNDIRMNQVLNLLKSENIKAINEDNEWIYPGPLNTLVACFKALEDLKYINDNIQRTKLQKCVRSKIKFKSDDRLFRECKNEAARSIFKKLFTNQIY